jgi:hypothetical protein
MRQDYEDRNFQIDDFNGNTTTFNARVFYGRDNKPCAVVVTDSYQNTGMKLAENTQLADKATNLTASVVARSHPNLTGKDKFYAFTENQNGSFKQQPYEVIVSGSAYDQSASQKTVNAYAPSDRKDVPQPLESVSKGEAQMTVMQLQGKNILAEAAPELKQ